MIVFKHFLIIWDEGNAYKSWKGAVASDNSLAASGERWLNHQLRV